MRKKLSTGLKSLFIIIVAIVIVWIFGIGTISKFVFKQVLFTPYNIVGIIMTLVTICGGYITRRQGHWLKYTLTVVSGVVTVLSWIGTVLSWFKINLFDLLWTNVLHPTVVTVGTVLLWIVIAIISITLSAFAIYGIVKLICYIKEAREWKRNKKAYEQQRDLVSGIARENSENNFEVAQTVVANNDITSPKSVVESIVTQAPQPQEISFKTSSNSTQSEKQIILPDDYELQISNNICPVCGWYLKKRINSQTGEQFRGCSNYGYHNCTFTISDEEYLRIYKKYH